MPESTEQKLEAKIETDWSKFTQFIRTLELKLFHGKLYQKATNPSPGVEPDHVWIPVESHNVDAPAPGEPIAEEQTRRSGDPQPLTAAPLKP
jgi:hypothetical protein